LPLADGGFRAAMTRNQTVFDTYNGGGSHSVFTIETQSVNASGQFGQANVWTVYDTPAQRSVKTVGLFDNGQRVVAYGTVDAVDLADIDLVFEVRRDGRLRTRPFHVADGGPLINALDDRRGGAFVAGIRPVTGSAPNDVVHAKRDGRVNSRFATGGVLQLDVNDQLATVDPGGRLLVLTQAFEINASTYLQRFTP
jgi:hypothetical protein